MGRPPKALEGIPPSLEKLTEKQAELLAWVYWSGLGDATPWSAKALLGRSPTKSEAATLSGRVKNLVDQGVLERNGRDIKLTQEGWVLLYNYASSNQGNPVLEALPTVMELGRTRRDLDSFADIITTAIRYLGEDVITMEEFKALRAALKPLRQGVTKRHQSLGHVLKDRQAHNEE